MAMQASNADGKQNSEAQTPVAQIISMGNIKGHVLVRPTSSHPPTSWGDGLLSVNAVAILYSQSSNTSNALDSGSSTRSSDNMHGAALSYI